MNEPRRLLRSGGTSQRLLDSASLDKPSEAARRRAEALAGTAGSFARSAIVNETKAAPAPSVAKTLATWALIGAAASSVVAYAASRLLDRGETATAASALAPMAELPSAAPVLLAPPSDIAPESASALTPLPSAGAVKPPARVVPWVPSPVPYNSAPRIAPSSGKNAAPRSSSAAFDEARDIEAARDAVSRGDNSAAIAKLNQYDQAHPNGDLKAESTVLRVQALSNSGNFSEAKRLANEFTGKNPSHPLTPRLKDAAP